MNKDNYLQSNSIKYLALLLVPILLSALCLMGCVSSTAKSSGSSSVNEDFSQFEGTWVLIGSTTDSGEAVPREKLEKLYELGNEAFFNLSHDGTAAMAMFGANYYGYWTGDLNQPSKAYLHVQGLDAELSLDGSTIVCVDDKGERDTYERSDPLNIMASTEYDNLFKQLVGNWHVVKYENGAGVSYEDNPTYQTLALTEDGQAVMTLEGEPAESFWGISNKTGTLWLDNPSSGFTGSLEEGQLKLTVANNGDIYLIKD